MFFYGILHFRLQKSYTEKKMFLILKSSHFYLVLQNMRSDVSCYLALAVRAKKAEEGHVEVAFDCATHLFCSTSVG